MSGRVDKRVCASDLEKLLIPGVDGLIYKLIETGDQTSTTYLSSSKFPFNCLGNTVRICFRSNPILKSQQHDPIW